jgi:hypothetical protein
MRHIVDAYDQENKISSKWYKPDLFIKLIWFKIIFINMFLLINCYFYLI